MIFADYLSRNSPTKAAEIELDKIVHQVVISEEKLKKLKEETDIDETLNCLKSQITEGWPESPREVPQAIKQFWSMRDYLSVEDGLILKNTAIIIPKSMQSYIVNKIHEAHQGIEKCLLKARDNVFWIGMTKNITERVKACETCEKYGKSNPKQPLLQHEIPSRPFEKIAADIFQLGGQNFLLVADYYSKMPFVKSLRTLSSKETIDYLESIFAIHGIPRTLLTDNAKQFTSLEFKTFQKQWEFNHVTSSPYYPQSNGFIERMVQTVKNCLKKSKETKQNPQLALLALRTTPVDNSLPSPAELLFNRKVQNQIPHLARDNHRTESVKKHLIDRQMKQKMYYDRDTQELTNLIPQQQVAVQDTNTKLWSPAKVIKASNEPRSFIMETPSGTMLRRNRKHLKDSGRRTSKTMNNDREYDYDEEEDTTNTQSPASNNHEIPTTPTPDNATEVLKGQIAKPHTRSGRTIKPPKRYIEEN